MDYYGYANRNADGDTDLHRYIYPDDYANGHAYRNGDAHADYYAYSYLYEQSKHYANGDSNLYG
jgi:hypothetical protein